eukprot:365473-Chlamydomonas_euryale.AAC.6
MPRASSHTSSPPHLAHAQLVVRIDLRAIARAAGHASHRRAPHVFVRAQMLQRDNDLAGAAGSQRIDRKAQRRAGRVGYVAPLRLRT